MFEAWIKKIKQQKRRKNECFSNRTYDSDFNTFVFVCNNAKDVSQTG